MKSGSIAMAEIDEKIGANRGSGKKFAVNACFIKAGHWPGIKPEAARRYNQKTGLNA